MVGAALENMARHCPPKLEYRPDIDGLRALAVLSVVGFHAFPQLVPGGFFGVDVFFVISGFLISTLILEQLRRSTFSLLDFYRRRVRRIFPALLLVLAACLAFGWYALLPEELEYLGRQVAAAAAFGSNFALWGESGYFAPATQLKPLLHLWSLGIEEQFYLCWPLLLALLWRRTARMGVAIAALTAGSFLWCVILVQRNPTAAFYFPLARFWELGLGCLAAWLRQTSLTPAPQLHVPPRNEPAARPVRWLSRVCSLMPAAGVALILIAVFAVRSHKGIPGWPTLLPTAGALCVVGTTEATWFRRRVLAHRALVFVGLISYALYLWHWPILSFAAILEGGTAGVMTRLCCLLLSGLLALATFELIERPLRTGYRPKRLNSALIGSMAVAGLAGFVLFAGGGFARRFDAHVRAVRSVPKTDELCEKTVGTHIPLNYCKRTRPEHPEVVFLGDSQTQAVYDGTVAALGSGYPLLLLGRGGCPPVLNVHVQGVYPSDATRRSCNSTWSKLVRFVRRDQPRVVVLVGAGTRFFDIDTRDLGSAQAAARERAFKLGSEELLRALPPATRVVYLQEIPEFPHAPACYLRPVKLPGTHCSPFVARGVLEQRRAAYRQALDELRNRFPQLTLIDPLPALCTNRYCPQELASGEILYHDEVHLSEGGGRRVATHTPLAELLRDALDYPG